MASQTAKARYEKLQTDRSGVLDRARHNALLTIPSLVPLENQSDQSHLYEPYQGLGAKGVVFLASRIASALVPVNSPFFVLRVPTKATAEFEGGKVPEEVQKQLQLIEQQIQAEVDRRNWRSSVITAAQQLIVAGNVLEQILPDNNIAVRRMDSYVTRRDWTGALQELVIHEKMAAASLPEEAREALKDSLETKTDEDGNHDFYTWARLTPNGKKYEVSQWVGDTLVEKLGGEFDKDKLPYLALRWTVTPGEDYGRSKIEEHIGDLRSLENLEKTMLDGAAMASRNVIMVKPGATGGGVRNKLARANNGDVIVGDWDQISTLSFENVRGLQVTQTQVQQIRESLSAAFLLNSAVQRDAERVTATEINKMVEELEVVLGGVFSMLAQEMMRKRLEILIDNMVRKGQLPKIIRELDIQVVTGAEALQRERDVQRVMQAGQIIQAFGEQAMDWIVPGDLIRKALLGLGLPDVVRSPQEVQQIQQQRQEAALAERAAPQLAQAAAQQGQPQQ